MTLTLEYIPKYNVYVVYHVVYHDGLTLEQKEYLRINKIEHYNHYAFFHKDQEKELSFFLLKFNNATVA